MKGAPGGQQGRIFRGGCDKRPPRLAWSNDAMADIPARVMSTPAADEWIARLTAMHGPLMFHQSGGCCDGSVPMCYPRGEFKVGGQDVLLGHIAGDVPVWIGAAQFEYARNTQLTIDVAPGRGAGMSLETPEGIRFLGHARLFTDAEALALEEGGPPPRGES